MLNSTEFDNGIKIPARELELLMLIIRSCMKVRARDIFLHLFLSLYLQTLLKLQMHQALYTGLILPMLSMH